MENNDVVKKTKSKQSKSKITFDMESKRKTKNTERVSSTDTNLINGNLKSNDTPPLKPPKKKKKVETVAKEEQEGECESSNLNDSKGKKPESKRALKRKKHQQLILEKKIKTNCALQEKCLNYLSHWKHHNSDWKFEKLKQIWLQQNMFDCKKVPEEFWQILVDYFNNAKGKIRENIVTDAVKIIEEQNMTKTISENEDNDVEDNKDEEVNDMNVKILRAKHIVQFLQ